jgi:hypothetical protein
LLLPDVLWNTGDELPLVDMVPMALAPVVGVSLLVVSATSVSLLGCSCLFVASGSDVATYSVPVAGSYSKMSYWIPPSASLPYPAWMLSDSVATATASVVIAPSAVLVVVDGAVGEVASSVCTSPFQVVESSAAGKVLLVL